MYWLCYSYVSISSYKRVWTRWSMFHLLSVWYCLFLQAQDILSQIKKQKNYMEYFPLRALHVRLCRQRLCFKDKGREPDTRWKVGCPVLCLFCWKYSKVLLIVIRYGTVALIRNRTSTSQSAKGCWYSHIFRNKQDYQHRPYRSYIPMILIW